MAEGLIVRPRGFGKISCAGIAEKSGRLDVLRSDQIPDDVDYDVVFRWGCRSTLPFTPSTTINNIPALKKVGNKAEFRMECWRNNLAPHTYLSLVGLFQSNHDLSSGWVVRPSEHKQGKNLHVCRTEREFIDVCSRYERFYISKLIDKVKEYRAIVAQGRVIFIYEKIPDDPTKVAWNHAQGGTSEVMKWSEWPENVIEIAIRSSNLSGLSFGAVDIMVDRDGRAYCLEINTAPETTSEYRQKCFAKVFNYILDNGSQTIPVVSGRGWKGYIHPAMSELACT